MEDYELANELTESPELMSGELSITPAQRKNILNDFLRSRYETVTKDIRPGYDLIKKGRKFAIIDKNKKDIYYYMQYETRKILGKMAAYQVLVWRSALESDLAKVSMDVFFEQLFDNNDLVSSDKSQTHLGHRFWLSAVDRALSLGYNVYYFDFLNPTKTKKILNKFVLDIPEVKNTIWGREQKHQARLLLISKKELPYDSIFEEYDNFGIPLGI